MIIIFIFSTILFIISFILTQILVNFYIKKIENIFHYYVNNFCFSFSCSVFYVFTFFVASFFLRCYNISNNLDLNVIKSYLINFIILYSSTTSILTQFIFLNVIIINIINLILFINLTNKYLISHVFNLYLFFVYNTNNNFITRSWLFNKLKSIADTDVISYFLNELSFYITYRFSYNYNISWSAYYANLPWYHYHKIISGIISNKLYKNFIIPGSPIIIIIYDILYNDLIITHIYYYLIIYIPLMILRKITKMMSSQEPYICELIWNILYKREICFYALSKSYKQLFDLYIKNDLKILYINPKLLDADLQYSVYMKESSRFVFNKIEKCYQNSDNVEIYNYAKSLPNSVIKVTHWLDGEELHEYWILIVDKT